MSLVEVLEALFTYRFMINALIVGIMIGLSGAFLGSFLILKKYSMIGDGLAHVSFAAVAIALFFNQQPLVISLILVTIAAIFILRLSSSANIGGDAAIGLLSSFSIAFGTILVSIRGGFSVDLYSYLFGSILLLNNFDVYLSIILSLFVVVMVITNYKKLFMITYDETFAKTKGVSTTKINYLLAILTAITVTIGIRALGIMLISSLIIFPTVIALQFYQGFKRTIIIASISSVSLVVLGLIISLMLDLPSGSVIVVLNGLVFMAIYLRNRLVLGEV